MTVTVDIASAGHGDRDRDDSMPDDDWFATSRFPRAVFTANRFVDRGGGRYEAQGELVLKGVRRPVVLPFTLAISGGVAKMQGQATLDRTAFNVGSGKWTNARRSGARGDGGGGHHGARGPLTARQRSRRPSRR